MNNTKPNYIELALIGILAALQPIVEWFFGMKSAAQYNILAVVIIGMYLGIVIWKTRGAVFRAWGLRTDNFASSLVPYGIFTVIASAVIWIQGAYIGNNSLPGSFWYVLLLYPLWGIAQQFALQNLVVRNLSSLIPSITARALLVTLLFGIVHLPSIPLFFEAGIAGFFFVMLYHRFPNLYAIGIAHGVVGALVFHLILGQNQWEVLLKYFG